MKAFPHDSTNQYGMDLRDYFASKILQAKYIRDNLADGYMDKMCEEAYQYADAMIKAREKTK